MQLWPFSYQGFLEPVFIKLYLIPEVKVINMVQAVFRKYKVICNVSTKVIPDQGFFWLWKDQLDAEDEAGRGWARNSSGLQVESLSSTLIIVLYLV